MSDRVQRLVTVLVLGCALAVCAGGVAAAKASHRTAHKRAHRIAHHDGHSAGPYTTALNLALAGTATASTEAAGSPASNAIDGDASTQWCSAQWTGNVTVDLGSVRVLNGFGLTLGSGATTALVNISAGDDPNALTPVPDLQQQTPEANTPEYWPLHGTLRARYVKIDVTDNDGTPPCIGEFRAFSPMSSSVIPDRGADLSFEPQEEAAGATFSDAGVAGPAMQILQPSRAELRAPAAVGRPAAGLQQPRQRPDDGPAHQGRGARAVPRHPLLRLLGRPPAPDHPRGLAGSGSRQLTTTVRGLHAHVSTPSRRRARRSTWSRSATRSATASCGRSARWTGPTDTGWDNLVTLLKAGVAGAREGNPAGHRLRSCCTSTRAETTPTARTSSITVSARRALRRDRPVLLHVLPRAGEPTCARTSTTSRRATARTS